MSAYYLTTPIYYANDVPHIGHAYTTIAADAIARFQRQRGSDVFLLTGTDEHGVNIERIASSAGVSPAEHVDRIASAFGCLWHQLDIGYDRFIRTTELAHERSTLALWQRLQASGDLYRGVYEGAYCARCEAYYQPEELVDEVCPVHRLACERVSEENWFFRLSRHQSALEELVGQTDFVQPRSRRNEVLSVVKEGLRDFSASRKQVRWGIPVPENPDEVIYVWVDALANYLTGVGFPDAGFERYWPAQLHLVGKEIIRFHCLYWPALLLSAGLAPPRQVFAHGWLTRDGHKISKSTGNTIDMPALVAEFGSDAVRHFLLRSVPFGQDGDFTLERFKAVYTADLANGFGNFVQRACSLAVRYGVEDGEAGAHEIALRNAAAVARERVVESVERLALHEALAACGEFVSEANRYLEVTQPWHLADASRRGLVVRETVAAARVAAELYAPFIPRASAEAQRRLRASPPIVGKPLFHRV